MKHILSSITLIVLLVCCEKEKASSLYMSGYIYNNCYDRQPYRNGPIQLYRTNSGSNTGQTLVATDSTDANGYFKIYFPPSDRQNTMILKIGNGGDIMEKIPPTDDIDSVEVFFRIYANIKVSLNVINPHSNGDTLIIGNFSNGGGELKIPCPLTSGTIYTAMNWTPLETQAYGFTNEQIAWTFKPSPGFVYSQQFKIDKYCQDTVYVTVDIN